MPNAGWWASERGLAMRTTRQARLMPDSVGNDEFAFRSAPPVAGT